MHRLNVITIGVFHGSRSRFKTHLLGIFTSSLSCTLVVLCVIISLVLIIIDVTENVGWMLLVLPFLKTMYGFRSINIVCWKHNLYVFKNISGKNICGHFLRYLNYRVDCFKCRGLLCTLYTMYRLVYFVKLRNVVLDSVQHIHVGNYLRKSTVHFISRLLLVCA